MTLIMNIRVVIISPSSLVSLFFRSSMVYFRIIRGVHRKPRALRSILHECVIQKRTAHSKDGSPFKCMGVPATHHYYRSILRFSMASATLTIAISAGCGGPRDISPRIYDAGPVFIPAQKKLDHNFLVDNPYNEPVRVVSVRKSCTCTEATLGPAVIRPGRNTNLNVSVDVKNIFKSWSIQCVLDTNLQSDPEWV